MRVATIVRMQPGERERIDGAAKAAHMSRSGFMLAAALAMASGNGKASPSPAEGLGAEAHDAVECLVKAGMGNADAIRRARAALAANPAATAGEILAAAYQNGAV